MPLSIVRDIFTVDELISKKPFDLGNGKHLYDEDLSFSGHETQHSTHSLHTYVAAINPPLAKTLIETYFPKNENVLDPFCGGGGVLVESILSGRNCAGGDVNPLGVLISKAKTTYIPKIKIEKFSRLVLESAMQKVNTVEPAIDQKTRFWFKEYMMPPLASLSEAINEVTSDDTDIKTLFQVVFSATIRDIMLTYRGEVRLRKLTGRDYERFNPDIFDAFKKRSNLAIDRVSSLPQNEKADIDIRDVTKLSFGDEEFFGIVCSPPYADDKNGVGYFQFSRNMLSWLGFNPDDVNKHKQMVLGSNKKEKMPPKSESLAKSLENVKKRKLAHYDEAVAFYHDYDKGLAEMARVTKKWIIIVVGNRVLSRTQFNNAAITVDLYKNLGIELKHHYTRELKKKRIANLGSDGGGIAKEHILVFSK
jgi:hypothetical protein